MRTLLIYIIAAAPLLSQSLIRIDPTPVMTTSGTVTPGGYPSLYAVAGAQVTLYTDYTLTTTATTYTDISGNNACPAYAQITLAGSSVCVSAADQRGNYGWWVVSGNYVYVIHLQNGQTYGPYSITPGTGATTAANVFFTQQGAGAVTRTVQSKEQDTFSVNDFCGNTNHQCGDARSAADGVANGTTTFTSATGAFTSADVTSTPKYFEMYCNSANDFVTTIASVVNSTTIMLASPPGFSGTGCYWVIATDSTNAFQNAVNAAYNAVQVSGNHVPPQIYVPAGYYLTGTITWHGEGIRGDGPGSIIQGKPGQDTFATIDPSSVSYKQPIVGANVEKLTMYVNGTVDASGSFNRPSGQNTTTPYSWTVGNAAFAFNIPNGSHFGGEYGGMKWRSLAISQWPLTGGVAPGLTNNTAGIFTQYRFQGQDFKDVYISYTYFGIVLTPPASNSPIWAPDLNILSGITLKNIVPFVWYGGDHDHIEDFQVYSGTNGNQLGLFILDPKGSGNQPTSWSVDNIWVENIGNLAVQISQLDGVNHYMKDTQWGFYTNGAYSTINASQSFFDNVYIGNTSGCGTNTINVVGMNNKMNLREQSLCPATQPSDITSAPSNDIRIYTSAVFPPPRPTIGILNQASHLFPTNYRNASALLNINPMATSYYNSEDSFLGPESMQLILNGNSCTPQTDLAAPFTGVACLTNNVSFPGSLTISSVDGIANGITVGKRVPATVLRYYVTGETVSGYGSQTMQWKDSTNANLNVSGSSITAYWGPTYTTNNFLIDSTSAVTNLNGNFGQLSSSVGMKYAWMYFVPVKGHQQEHFNVSWLANGSGNCASANNCLVITGGVGTTVGLAASTGQTITVGNLPAHSVVDSVMIIPVTSCSGGSLSNVTAAVGDSTFNEFAPSYTVFGAASSSNFQFTSPATNRLKTLAADTLSISLSSTSANVSALTQCSFDVFVNWTYLNQ